ncbi:hypothetical protein [Frigoriglobus tundricola]|uniref:Uncharacterized protein n=1 Tax=Frigoriglobus tundricola TaxID=2774151 RepID=A0A6M5YV19_9BACT|nr:hypothetical protein [Frigoriglobus tundricola]QJW96742.1 hypothetical protein FTUN_4301 [Frigoriglobus tundricola]
MLRSLARWKFVDRMWGPEDLELIAKFWLQLYDEVDHPPHKVWESHQTLELHLTGFTRSASRTVSDELARRLPENGVPVSVSSADPDTLVAITKPREGDRRPLIGVGVAALAGGPFDGMLVEIRFTVADAGATEGVRGLFGATLVIVGELRGGTVAVKSVWADPPFVTIEAFWDNPGEWEDYYPGK